MRKLVSALELVGETIVSARTARVPKCDDEPYLKIKTASGKTFSIEAQYGGYTGGSEDEYPKFISIYYTGKKQNL